MSRNAGTLWSKTQACKRHSGTSQLHHTHINQKDKCANNPFSFAACREMTHWCLNLGSLASREVAEIFAHLLKFNFRLYSYYNHRILVIKGSFSFWLQCRCRSYLTRQICHPCYLLQLWEVSHQRKYIITVVAKDHNLCNFKIV